MYNDGNVPGLADVFGTVEGHVISVLNIKPIQCASCQHVFWPNATWTCSFVGQPGLSWTSVQGNVNGGDPHGHTLTIDCEVPAVAARKIDELGYMSLGWGTGCQPRELLRHRLLQLQPCPKKNGVLGCLHTNK